MARPERPIDPTEGPVQQFALELRLLRKEAGCPSYNELAERTHFSRTVLAEAARGIRKPTLHVTLAYVKACGGDTAWWEKRWQELVKDLAADKGATIHNLRPNHMPVDDTLAALRRGIDAFVVDFFERQRQATSSG